MDRPRLCRRHQLQLWAEGSSAGRRCALRGLAEAWTGCAGSAVSGKRQARLRRRRGRLPGAPLPRPPPLTHDGAEVAGRQSRLSVATLAKRIPDGEGLLRRHEEEESAQRRHAEATIDHLVDHARPHVQQRGGMPPCWATSDGRRGRYLAECTADGCHGYDDLALASAVCEVLGTKGCGGVTAANGVYQTRFERRLRRGPTTERSWVKRAC